MHKRMAKFLERHPKYRVSALMERVKGHRKPFIKFLLVGVSATFLTLGLLYLFTEYFQIYYVISGLLASQLSIFWSFIWHDNWTWAKRRKQKGLVPRFMAFEGIYVSSIIANNALLYLFTEFLKTQYLLSMGMAIGITFTYNYVMHSRITFKETS
ncbi:MAG: GtrA family protein [Candidatus Micrarchaeota archaeon]